MIALFSRIRNTANGHTVPLSLIAIVLWASHAPFQIKALAADDSSESNAVTFDQVRPVFRKHCESCHNIQRPRGEFDISSVESIKAGSVSGIVAIPGKPEESPLFTLPAHLDDPHMPPNAKKIPQRELDLIRNWIAGGMLASPKSTTNPPSAKKSENQKLIVPVASISRQVPPTALAINPKTSVVAIAGQRQVALFSLADRQWQHAFPFPEGDIHLLRFSSDGELLLAAGGEPGESGRIIGFDVATGKRRFELGDESDVILAADISPNGQLVAIGGPGRKVKLLRVRDGETIAELRRHTDWILSVAFSPDGLLLASSDRFGSVEIWEAETGAEFASLRGHAGAVHALAFERDSTRLVSAGQDGTVRTWNLHRSELEDHWIAQPSGLLTLQLPAKDRILTGGRGGPLSCFRRDHSRLWEVQRPGEVVELAVTGDGDQAVAADGAGQIVILAMQSGKQIGEIVFPIDTASTQQLAVLPGPRRIPPRKAVSVSEPAPMSVNDDLSETLAALAAAEATVKSTEEALVRARQAAAQLKALVKRQEAARQSKPLNKP